MDDLLLRYTESSLEGKQKLLTEMVEVAKKRPDYAKFVLRLSRQVTPPEHQGLKVAILGYSSPLVGNWDPSTTATGLPGSEECVVYASQELVKQGCDVTVYMNPSSESIWTSPFSNPKWLSDKSWYLPENKEKYDLVVMWRRSDLGAGKARGKFVFFWPHDSYLSAPTGLPFPPFDGALILSEHHRRQLSSKFSGIERIPYTICGNGILPEQFSELQEKKNPSSIGYFSNYSRGLEILISFWPELKKKFPKATLDICYGREHWNTMSKERLELLVSKIEKYKTLDITEHGKVGHERLAEIMKNTSVWAYPCTDPGETFCITATKTQAAGCVPVTTRIGALAETVHPEAVSLPLITSSQDVSSYKELLFSVLEDVEKYDRGKFVLFAKKFSWEACISKWLQLFHKISRTDKDDSCSSGDIPVRN